MAELIKENKNCDYLGGEEMPLQKNLWSDQHMWREARNILYTKKKKSYLINVRIPGAGEMIVEVG